jgi:pyruvate dehydrogenase complex dehydrogenase (E1) component
MMLNLDDLRDKLDNMLNKETADSLNQWLNNKRDMDEEVMARIEEVMVRTELVGVLDDIQSMMHELTLSELNELIDELTHLYERYNVYAQSRNGDKPE